VLANKDLYKKAGLDPETPPTTMNECAEHAKTIRGDGSKFTLPVAVVAMRERSFGAIDYGALEAGVMVMAIPCVILFLVLQRHYVQGFTSGAIRG
jgi:ABC-type glycerol-3-phosphate transport system permease component